MKTVLSAILTLALFAVPLVRADETADLTAVKAAVALYKQSLETLDAAKASQLFADDSQVFESGGVEGTYAHYLPVWTAIARRWREGATRCKIPRSYPSTGVNPYIPCPKTPRKSPHPAAAKTAFANVASAAAATILTPCSLSRSGILAVRHAAAGTSTNHRHETRSLLLPAWR